MNRILAVLAAVGVSVVAAHGDNGIGIFGSSWDAGDMGTGRGGGIKFSTGLTPYLALEFRGSFISDFDENDPVLNDMSVIPIEADLVLRTPPLGDVLTIYAGGGAGYYVFPEYESAVPAGASGEPDIDPDDEFGYFAVGGIDIKLSKHISVFGEVRYTDVELEQAEIDDVETDFKVDLAGVGYSVGLMVSW